MKIRFIKTTNDFNQLIKDWSYTRIALDINEFEVERNQEGIIECLIVGLLNDSMTLEKTKIIMEKDLLKDLELKMQLSSHNKDYMNKEKDKW